MQRLKCPVCNASVLERDLLSHPPGESETSRALTRRYCPACTAEVRVLTDLRWWQVLIALAIPCGLILVNHLFLAPSVRPWANAVAYSLAGLLTYLLSRNARRLVATRPQT